MQKWCQIIDVFWAEFQENGETETLDLLQRHTALNFGSPTFGNQLFRDVQCSSAMILQLVVII